MSCSQGYNIIKDEEYSVCAPNVCPYEYSYDYSYESQCKVTKEAKHLKIVCWTKSYVSIGSSKNLTLTEMKLYSPSINTWDGVNAKAEIVLKHVDSEGKITWVCVPVDESRDGAGADIDFFNSINEAVKVLVGDTNGTMKLVELGGGFTLNKLIPISSFYYAEGDGLKFSNGPCDAGMNNIIIFPKSAAIKMKPDVTIKLQSLISKYNPPRREIEGSKSKNGHPGDGQFSINEVGTKANTMVKDSKTGVMAMTCEPVIDPSTQKNVSAPKDTKRFASDNFSGLPKEKMWKYIKIVVGIIVGLGLVFVLYWILFPTPYFHWKNKPGGDVKIKVNRVTHFIGQRMGFYADKDD
tara:strand:- start:1673 stop:2725 length:1053 start_codon:yes stop_codon:yes gene_type:complete